MRGPGIFFWRFILHKSVSSTVETVLKCTQQNFVAYIIILHTQETLSKEIERIAVDDVGNDATGWSFDAL